ncbi:hypothetical protein BGY98DRAFT_72212 [Russula aff. rugulosa BPL654]|nr:hypothetical protein BGY98DRAFT_72212 [Russula aff. rugulosa BPL654]
MSISSNSETAARLPTLERVSCCRRRTHDGVQVRGRQHLHNKTWSEAFSIELNDINKSEREFLAGIDFKLCGHYVGSSDGVRGTPREASPQAS